MCVCVGGRARAFTMYLGHAKYFHTTMIECRLLFPHLSWERSLVHMEEKDAIVYMTWIIVYGQSEDNHY